MNVETLLVVGGATLALGVFLAIPGYFLAKYFNRRGLAHLEYLQRRQAAQVILPPDTSLILRGGFAPPGFVHGVELLNDGKTTMGFVVQVLVEQLGLKKRKARAVMLNIHQNGGALISLPSEQKANEAAWQITVRAKALNFPLVCRAVSAQPVLQADDPASGGPAA